MQRTLFLTKPAPRDQNDARLVQNLLAAAGVFVACIVLHILFKSCQASSVVACIYKLNKSKSFHLQAIILVRWDAFVRCSLLCFV